MNARALKGKTIKKVTQVKWEPGGFHSPEWVIKSIEFTDGTKLSFRQMKGEDGTSAMVGVVTE